MADYAGLPAGPLAAYLGVRDNNNRQSALNQQMDFQQVGMLGKLQELQQQQQVRSVLQNSPDFATAQASLTKLGTPTALGTLKELMAVEQGKSQLAATGRMEKFRNDLVGGSFNTPGAPAHELPQGTDALGQTIQGPTAPAVAPRLDTQRMLAGAIAASSDPIKAAAELRSENKPIFAPRNSPGYYKDGVYVATPSTAEPAPLSPLAKLLADKARLAPDDPRHQMYEAAITHATNPQSQRIVVGDHAAYTNVQPDGQGGFIGLSKKTNQIEKIPQAEGATAGTQLSGDALETAAETYRLTRKLPTNLGRGMQGAANTVKILTRSAELAKAGGDDAQATAINQIANQARSGALNQMEKQATMVGAFEKNANMNADLALQFSEKADRTGIPVFNRWLLAGQKELMGDPDVTKFNTANYTFINEYAKVVSGSMGNTAITDSARKHANEVLSTSQTKDQYRENIGLLKQEMRNRMKGFDDQRKELVGGIAGNRRATDKPSDIRSQADAILNAK